MWFVMSNVQQSYDLSERLIRAISNWRTLVGQNDDIEQLLEAGADVNQLHGLMLPLQCACMAGDIYSLKLLLEWGARVNAVDGYGRAAVHYAAERDVTCLETLLQYGAQANAQDSNQNTPLHWASFKNNAHCVRRLLEYNAGADAVNFNHDTPISWAAMKSNQESLKVLLEYNADVTVRTLDEKTALLRCAALQASGLNDDSDDACLELLLKANGQFDLRDNYGELPNQIASDNKLSEMLMPYCENPRSLQALTRFRIRRCLGPRFLPNVIPKLPLPSSLHEYLLLER